MLNQFLKYLSVEKNYSARTVRSYGDDLKQFYSYVQTDPEEKSALNVPPRTVRAWLSHLLDQQCAPRTVNRKLSSLRAFFRFLTIQGVISNSPLQKVVAPRSGKRLPVFLKPSETEKLLDPELFPEGFLGLRDTLVIGLFYFTGLRVSELAQLQLHCIDLANATLRVMGKGSKERLVPIHPELKQLLTDYLAERDIFFPGCPSPYLILNNYGQPSYPQLLYRIVKKYVAQVSTIEKKSPHVLRHTFATHLLNRGADINAIKELLGHANLSATQIYTHTSFEKLRKTYAQTHPRA